MLGEFGWGQILGYTAALVGVVWAVGYAFSDGFFTRKRRYNRELLDDLEQRDCSERRER